ncbi:MAG: mercury resistance system periplasmic binding protein MerP [Pseudomonadota bacterium]
MRKIVSALAAVAMLSAASAVAGEQTVTLKVDGMFCDLCPAIVKKSLTRVDGVRNATVSYETTLATVTFDDARTNIEALIKATTNAGYRSQVAK